MAWGESDSGTPVSRTYPSIAGCMWDACKYTDHMAKMVQIRNVPDAVHRQIKARAALAGMSLSEYLLREIREILERPTTEELLRRLDSQSRVKLDTSVVEIIREERDKR